MIKFDLVRWAEFKAFANSRQLRIQYRETDTFYHLKVSDNWFGFECNLHKQDDAVDVADFEANHKDNANAPLLSEVTTQFEKNDKTTKLCKAKAQINAQTKTATILVKVPGVPGSGDGRFISGGFAIADDYDKDDYATARIKDEDRMLAWQVALAQDPNAIEPLSDAAMQAVGTLPEIGDISKYPYIRSYTEEDLDPENEGWFFWPLAQGNNLPPVGETEVEALGGYGFLPSGFYLEINYIRQTLTTGTLRVNLEWGRLE
jgi:hypothetical protein